MNYNEAVKYVSTKDNFWEELTPMPDDLVQAKKVDKKTIRWGIITLAYWIAWIVFFIIYK